MRTLKATISYLLLALLAMAGSPGTPAHGAVPYYEEAGVLPEAPRGMLRAIPGTMQDAPQETADTTADPENIEVVTAVTYILFLYLLLALFVERFMEILVAAFRYVEYRFFEKKIIDLWNRKAEKMRARLDKLYGIHGESAGGLQNVLDWILWKVVTEPDRGGKRVISAELLHLNFLRILSRVVSFVVSLVLVLLLQNMVHSFSLLERVAQTYLYILPASLEGGGGGFLSAIVTNPILNTFFSAAVISIGVEPLHKLISKIEQPKSGQPDFNVEPA